MSVLNSRFLLSLIVGISVFGLLQTYHLYRANCSLEEMTARAKTAEASVLSLQMERDSLTEALELQRKNLELVQAERNKINARLSNVLNTDPDTKSWATVPVPPALLGVFK